MAILQAKIKINHLFQTTSNTDKSIFNPQPLQFHKVNLISKRKEQLN